MDGFGVHTFRFENAAGETVLVPATMIRAAFPPTPDQNK